MSQVRTQSLNSVLGRSQLELALQHHERGQLDSAEQFYRQALAAEPSNAEAMQCAGVLALQRQQFDVAVERLQRATDLGSKMGGTYFLLGRAQKALGQLDAAIESYERAVGLDPALADAYVSLGIALKQKNRLDEAAGAHLRALVLQPTSFEAQLNLANVRQVQGKHEQALQHYERAQALRADSADLQHNIGKALLSLGRIDEAIAHFQTAIRLDAEFLDSYLSLAKALSVQKRHGPAADCYATLKQQLDARTGRISAVELRDAMQAECETGLLGALVWAARYEEALALLLPALEREPDSVYLLEHLLVIAPYRLQSRAEVLEWYRRYQRVIPLRDTLQLTSTERVDYPSKLRFGYLSGDFRDHSVAFFLEPILAQHDRASVVVYCYSCNERNDDVTTRLKGYADVWVEAKDLDPRALAERIAADRIDVLIDLSGRTASNRLGVLAHRPAALQVGYLGYPTYTGMHQIAFRVTDDAIDPIEEGADGIEGEQPLRLPHGMFCYRPPADAPDIAEYRRDLSRPICFGSFNQVPKLSPEVLDAWAEMLLRVAHSRLLLKAFGFADAECKRRVLDTFARHGVDSVRVTIVAGEMQRAEHLALYREIDIALDTFPYNGATTTCEALWMGVPVVTWVGETHASRMGASILQAAELRDLIATSRAEYVESVVALARDGARLKGLHESLRTRVAASFLRDEQGFTRVFEQALRQAWARRDNN